MSNTDAEDFESNMLASEYGVAKSVLSNLACKDLMKASSVCRLWHDVAEHLFLKTTSIHWDFCFGIKSNGEVKIDNFLDNFSCNIVSRPKFCICITNARDIVGLRRIHDPRKHVTEEQKRGQKWSTTPTSIRKTNCKSIF
jgi:hypothetical protein